MKKSALQNSVICAIIFLAISFGCNKENIFRPEIRPETESHWLGPDFWANRLQDWKLENGKIKCIAANSSLPLRTAHILTVRMTQGGDDLKLKTIVTFEGQQNSLSTNNLAGFLIGSGAPEMDYRSAALIHNSLAPHAGIFVGTAPDGTAFIKLPGDPLIQKTERLPSEKILREIQLEVTVNQNNSNAILVVETADMKGNIVDRQEIEISETGLLAGNLALAAHSENEGTATSFHEIIIGGDKAQIDKSREFGPIAFAMYTQSRGILKLTAQMMPLGESENKKVVLQIQDKNEWITIDTHQIIEPGFTVPFRIENWNSEQEKRYRIKYTDTKRNDHYYSGIIQAEPVHKDTFKVAALACYSHCFSNTDGTGGIPGWTNWDYEVFKNIREKWNPDDLFTEKNIWFPHNDVVNALEAVDPDLLAFTGDQVYEFKPTRAVHNAGVQTMLDYLYKWYLWGWSFGDLTKKFPTICMPDDHDVYQGNIWGMAGEKSPPGDRWTDGGYTESPEFVNMVQRTQTSHMPDPYDPTPIRQGIEVYYTSLDYGGVSFAILEDRKFKSSPVEDEQNAQLLGERQLGFVNDWTSDWQENIFFKSVISQTIFGGVNTHYGKIQKDKDTNGWPPAARNQALKAFRKGFAFMIGGDQHLGTIVHHGIDHFGDAGYSFVVPSVGCVWPRFWNPDFKGEDHIPGEPSYTGNYTDGFGNLITVHAVANPHITGKQPAYLHDLATGFGVVEFVKSNRSIIMECWPRFAAPGSHDTLQFKSWPKTIQQRDNYAREPMGYLPTIVFKNAEDPVVQLIHEDTGEIVYTLKIQGSEFTPSVFEPGKYTLKAGMVSTNFATSLTGLSPSSINQQIIEINLNEK